MKPIKSPSAATARLYNRSIRQKEKYKRGGFFVLTFILMIAAISATAQPNYNIGVGKSLNATPFSLQVGVGARIGSLLYIEGNGRVATEGYPTATVGTLFGAAHSWNNGKLHELTTIFYMKVDWVLAANDGYKSHPPVPFGVGVRHYVYEAFFDLSWQHSQAIFTIGYSLNNLYR